MLHHPPARRQPYQYQFVNWEEMYSFANGGGDCRLLIVRSLKNGEPHARDGLADIIRRSAYERTNDLFFALSAAAAVTVTVTNWRRHCVQNLATATVHGLSQTTRRPFAWVCGPDVDAFRMRHSSDYCGDTLLHARDAAAAERRRRRP